MTTNPPTVDPSRWATGKKWVPPRDLIRPTCEFLLDYEDEDEEDDTSGRSRQRRKPWRYRWPEDIRDEVLARLLKLNAERAEEERRGGRKREAEDMFVQT